MSPREAIEKVRYASYLHWFDTGKWTGQGTLFFYFSALGTCTYLRFRLGTHNLQVKLGRWQDLRPHHQRLCGRRHMQVVNDERHLVLEWPDWNGLELLGSICALSLWGKTCQLS